MNRPDHGRDESAETEQSPPTPASLHESVQSDGTPAGSGPDGQADTDSRGATPPPPAGWDSGTFPSLGDVTPPRGERHGNGGETVPGYAILGELGRGGMGAVFQGHDADLGRDVAIKVLLENHADKDELARRFVEEARIAGQLQHPGITPVYEMGRFPDRRPYFTMKLVKGQTLAHLLDARADPAEDRPRFIGIFQQVCQTLAYAHARGVIHRDLKPSNVMVGAFGEVQVMDWGLAKVLAEGSESADGATKPPEPCSVIRTQRSGDSETQAGSVLGTPAYMAPEQARGDIERVAERADVFGLGAILCEILTGKPPYTGKGSEAMRKARAATLDDARARLDACGADAELLALAKRCLAAEPWDRPCDANQVAVAVTVYQESVAERLRQAEISRAAAAARAEEAKATAEQERRAREAAQARAAAERRARRLTLGLAAAVLALLAVGAAGGLWVQRQWAEQVAEAARLRQGVEAALEKATGLGHKARWGEARAVLDQARDRLSDTGPEDLRQRVGRATADLALVDRLDSIRQKRASIVDGKFDYRTADQDYAREFREAGLGTEGESGEAVTNRVRASAVAEQLVAALDDWATVTSDRKRRAWLLEVARRAEPNAWGDRIRDPRVWDDRAALEALAAELLRDEAQLAKLKPPSLAALGEALYVTKSNAVPFLTAAQAHHPDDFWLHFLLGATHYDRKQWDESAGYYRGALAIRPDSAPSHNNLGTALWGKRKPAEAIREFRAAIALDPQYAQPHNNLGNALHATGHLDEAIREFRAAIALDPRYATAHFNLGFAVQSKGQLDEAIREYRTAIALDRRLAMPHNNLGLVLRAQGHLDEAIREYRTAITLAPRNATAHFNLGNALRAQGQQDEAIEEYRVAIALDPKYARPHNGLGNALYSTGQYDEAIRAYRAAIALDPKDAQPHFNLGNALRAQGHLGEAIRAYRAALQRDPRLATAYGALGQASMKLGRFADAAEAGRKCLALLPPGHPQRQAASELLRQSQQALAVDQRAAAILERKATAKSPSELLKLARFCLDQKKAPVAAARLYADAFAKEPALADDLGEGDRFAAARAAAQAGCGRGNDAASVDEQGRSRWRKRALDWLRADLQLWAKRLAKGDADDRDEVRQALESWRRAQSLAGLRDPGVVAKLPADERAGWQTLWADVAALLKKAETPK